MHEFTSPHLIRQLGAHDDAAVRRIVEDLRHLASELLLARLHTYAERYADAPEGTPIGELLWLGLREGQSRLEEPEAQELETLTYLADGWWSTNDLGEVELIDLQTWMRRHP